MNIIDNKVELFKVDSLEFEILNSVKSDLMNLLLAYDVKSVVEQLKDRSTLSRPVGWSKAYEIITLEDAIAIVRVGGKE